MKHKIASFIAVVLLSWLAWSSLLADGVLQNINGSTVSGNTIYGDSNQTNALNVSAAGVVVSNAAGSVTIQSGNMTNSGVFQATSNNIVIKASSLKVMSPSGSANDYLEFGATGNSRTIQSSANALGISYQFVGDSTGSGGPALLKFGSGALITFQTTARADAGSTDTGFGKSAGGGIEINTGTAGTLTNFIARVFDLPGIASTTTNATALRAWNSNNAAIYIRGTNGVDKLLISIP